MNNVAVCWKPLRALSTASDVKILKIGQSAGNLVIYHLPIIIYYFVRFSVLINGKCSMINVKRALRDCTPHTQTDTAVGDETVQTTTLKSLAAGESQCGK